MPGSIFVRSITPKRMVGINAKWMRDNVNRELKALGEEVIKEFEKPVARWNAPPKFRSNVVGAGTDLVSMAVEPFGPNATKFGWVDLGTKMRTIRPRRRGFLRFQPGYRASTRPGSLSSRTAKRSGGWRSATVVRNKIEARGFSKIIFRKFDREFKKRMENLIRRGLRAKSP